MQLFNFFDGNFALSVKGVSFLVFSVLAIAAVGYLLGRITIKGVNLGTAGVFLVALLYGCLFYKFLGNQTPLYTGNALKIVDIPRQREAAKASNVSACGKAEAAGRHR